VLASPRNACGSFENEAALANAIVLVERGGCRFTDKAMNVQTADGAVMILINDDGPAIRMPAAEDDTDVVHVPSLMVSQVCLCVPVCMRLCSKARESRTCEALRLRSPPVSFRCIALCRCLPGKVLSVSLSSLSLW
jgi:hypothetical protein